MPIQGGFEPDRRRSFAGKTRTCLSAGRVVGTLAILAGISASACGSDSDSPIPVDPSASEAKGGGSAPATVLRPRPPANKSNAQTALGPHVFRDRIVVKFVEGSRVRMRESRLSVDTARFSLDDSLRLSRSGISAGSARTELAKINDRLRANTEFSTARLMSLAESDLERMRQTGEAASGEELADMNLYYVVSAPPDKIEALVQDLNKSPLVEIAYLEPRPYPAAPVADKPPTTGHYAVNPPIPPPAELPENPPAYQGYLDQAPAGIDARWAWTRPGGTGAGVRIMDVEGGWIFTHEDLPAPFTTIGGNCDFRDHGVATLGEMVAAPNSYGVTGAAYGATYGTSSIWLSNLCVAPVGGAQAIINASNAIGSGDVLLIELHYFWFPPPGQICDEACGLCGTFGYVPVEFSQADFDAIKTATTNGRVVVEPAGNGTMNLDHSHYGSAFHRSFRDSGAIMVGAGIPGIPSAGSSARGPMCWSNYGSRVDVQGWGDAVMTLGYLDVIKQGDRDQTYTHTFNGTSAASPIVAAAAANVQGNRKALGLPVLSSTAMRALLNATGTQQPVPVTRNVGPLPNLRAAFAPGARPPKSGNLAAARQSTNITSVFAVGANGALQRRWVSGTGAWQGPAALTGTEFAPPGAPVAAALQAPNMLDVFFVGNNGALYVVWETNDGAWQPPKALTAASFAIPGSRIATGVRGTNELDVFVVDKNGALQMLSVVGTSTSWNPPQQIAAAGFAPPGAGLITGTQGTTQLDVLAIGNTGALKAVWSANQGAWQGPANISANSVAPPGSPLAAGKQGTNVLNVFFSGSDGFVKRSTVTGFNAWSAPQNLNSAGDAIPGGAITAAAHGTNQLDVFYVNKSSQTMFQYVVGTTGSWQGPTVAVANLALGGATTGAATQGGQLDLFALATSGIVVSQSSSNSTWSPATSLP